MSYRYSCAFRGRGKKQLHQELEVNFSGISNSITTVQKDTLVLEKRLTMEERITESLREEKRREEKRREEKRREFVGIKQATKDGYIKCEVGGVADFLYPTSKLRRGRVQGNGQISPTITSGNTGVCKVEKNMEIKDGVLYPDEDITQKTSKDNQVDWSKTEYRIRKLTAKECYRLMDVSEENADKMLAINSQTQCYKQAGNSIVVSVLCAVFSQLNIQGIKPWNERTIEEKKQLTALGQ